MRTKYAAIFVAMLLFTTTIIAQQSDTDKRESFSFGGKLGVNSSNTYASSGQDFISDSKAGIAFGIFGGIPFGTYIGFQPELMISQKGFIGSGTLLGNPYLLKRTTTFLEIPFLVQIKPIEFMTILIGPQYSYLMHEKNKFTFGDNSAEQQFEFNKEIARRSILGFVMGVDINISHIIITGRFGFDVQNNNGDSNSITPRYKNHWIQLGVGYKL
ncbi:MAG: porin family protein [Bacteroidales bacterium]|nr:porin family protein [Bacteroidales bacterium]